MAYIDRITKRDIHGSNYRSKYLKKHPKKLHGKPYNKRNTKKYTRRDIQVETYNDKNTQKEI